MTHLFATNNVYGLPRQIIDESSAMISVRWNWLIVSSFHRHHLATKCVWLLPEPLQIVKWNLRKLLFENMNEIIRRIPEFWKISINSRNFRGGRSHCGFIPVFCVRRWKKTIVHFLQLRLYDSFNVYKTTTDADNHISWFYSISYRSRNDYCFKQMSHLRHALYNIL